MSLSGVVYDDALHKAAHDVDAFCLSVMMAVNRLVEAHAQIGAAGELDALVNHLDLIHAKATEAHHASMERRH